MIHNVKEISIWKMFQYTGQSLVKGKDLTGITFSCSRNLHVELRSKVNSSLRGPKCKADVRSFWVCFLMIAVVFHHHPLLGFILCLSVEETFCLFVSIFVGFLTVFCCKLFISSVMFYNFVQETFIP